MAINDPVPSTAFDVLQRNVQDVDRYLNTSTVFNNRVGLPIKPIPMQAAEWQTAIGSVGWFPVGGDFSTGATLTARNQVIYDPASTAWYSWGGTLPKTVPASSSPASTGGISAGAWTMRSDAALATALNNGTALINGSAASSLNAIFEVPNLKALRQIPGAAQYSRSFYVAGSVGGGWYTFRPDVDKAKHDGGAFIAPEALSAWDGTPAGVLAFSAWTGAGSGVFVREFDSGFVTASAYGARVGTWSQDLLNKASAYTRDNRLALDVDIDCDINGGFYVYTDTGGAGTINAHGLGVLWIARKNAGTTVTPNLADMVRGGALSGVSGRLGSTLVVMSQEKLIDRVGNDGGAAFYLKEEVTRIVSDTGVIDPPWLNTYTTSVGLVVTAYAPEDMINVSVKLNYATTDAANFSVLRVSRDDATLSGTVTVTGTKANADVGLFVYDCTWVNANGLQISGFQSTLGYGVHQLRTAYVSLNKCDVTECRRPVANRFDKITRVNGGFYRSSGAVSCIDSHWADGIYLKSVRGYCKGKSILDFAGYNARVEDCDLIDALYVIGNRPDTPVAGGIVEIIDNRIHSTRDLSAFFGSQSLGENYAGAFDWSVPWPDLLRIRGNTIRPSTDNWSILRMNDSRFNRSQFGVIDVEGNEILGAFPPQGLVQLGCRALDTAPEYTATNPKIRISGVTFAEGSGFGLLEIQRAGATWKWDILLRDVYDLYYRLDFDVATRVEQIGGDFTGARTATFLTSTDPDRVPTFNFVLRDVTFTASATLYDSANKIAAFNCYYKNGALAYIADASDDKPISTNRFNAYAAAFGCYADAPSNAATLPPLDGWVSDGFFTRNAITVRNNGAIGASTLGQLGIGFREDTQELVIVNGAGAVRRIATT